MNRLVHNPLLRLFVAAFLVRLLFLLIFAGPNYFEGISHSYIKVAENVLDGKGAVIYVDLAPISAPLPQWSYEPFVDRPIGYVFLILLPLLLTSSPIGIQLLHALVAGASTAMVYHLGRTIFSERVALRAAILYAVWPLSARFEVAILPDALMSFFLLGTLLFFTRALKTERPLIWYACAGILTGIGMTMRPDIVFLPLFLVAWIFLTTGIAKHPLRSAFIFLLGFGLILGAQTARNYAASNGKFVPLGMGNGISMWEGISQFGDTLGTVFGDERLTQQEGFRSWAYPNGIERDQRRFREAIRIIRDHPWWYAGIMLKRIPVLITPDWIMSRKFAPSLKEFLNSSTDHALLQYVEDYPLASASRSLLILLQYASFFFAAAALWTGWRNPLTHLPALIIFYYIVIHIPTNTEARYFYPAIPFVLLLASQGWEWMKQKIHRDGTGHVTKGEWNLG